MYAAKVTESAHTESVPVMFVGILPDAGSTVAVDAMEGTMTTSTAESMGSPTLSNMFAVDCVETTPLVSSSVEITAAVKVPACGKPGGSAALKKQRKGHSPMVDRTHPAKNYVGRKEAPQGEILRGMQMLKMGKAMRRRLYAALFKEPCSGSSCSCSCCFSLPHPPMQTARM